MYFITMTILQLSPIAVSDSVEQSERETDRFVGVLAASMQNAALYDIARPSVRLSVRPSVTRVDQPKTVEIRIVQFSPYSSPSLYVFAR